MEKSKLKELVTGKNAILVILPIAFCAMLIILFIGNKNKSSNNSNKEQVLFEPELKDEELPENKIEAYEKDRQKEQQKLRLSEQTVRGSDFYFDMVNKKDNYEERRRERIAQLQKDPYASVVSSEFENEDVDSKSLDQPFSTKMRSQLSSVEDYETLNQIIREAKKDERLRKQIEQDEKLHNEMMEKLEKMYSYVPPEKETPSVQQTVTEPNEAVAVEKPNQDSVSVFLIEDGKRRRRSHIKIPQNKNLIRACIHGDQVIVSGAPVRMRLLESYNIGGHTIPANTIFTGIASLGASRLKIVVENLKVGTFISPVSFVIYDNDAIEGLNLPNNMKAEAAKRLEQGLLQGVQLPISSIGTLTSEITSAITATTQVAKQILNMSLSQVKVGLKANYQMYIQEESVESKKKREALDMELENLYRKMEEQQNDPEKINPLRSLIDQL
ncbi:MAG: hypothetical protein PEPC_01693 [Peptostreptococcus russellii]